MTPPVNPSMLSNHFRCMSLKTNTRDAPSAVIIHVKRVAMSAASMAPREPIHSIKLFIGQLNQYIFGYFIGYVGEGAPLFGPHSASVKFKALL